MPGHTRESQAGGGPRPTVITGSDGEAGSAPSPEGQGFSEGSPSLPGPKASRARSRLLQLLPSRGRGAWPRPRLREAPESGGPLLSGPTRRG